MHVAVDQSRRQRRAFSIDRNGRTTQIQIFLFPDALNYSIHRDHSIAIENRAIDVPTEQQPDVPDDQLI